MKIRSLFTLVASLFLITGCDPDDAPPITTDANFSISGFQSPVPATINFLNTSENATTYLWDFGDGNTSTQSNPTHSYSFPGTYLLRLKATGATGVDSVCKLMNLEMLNPPDKSAFSYFFDRCTGTPVGASFKTVNPASSNVVWDFGNGVINVNRDPIVQFLFPGDYTVKHSSLINGVRDTVTRIIQIH